jgi:transposase
LQKYTKTQFRSQTVSKAKSFRNSAINLVIKAISQDYEAIQNPIIFREYSNDSVKGKNTKLKLIKHGMFGRNQFDILLRKMLLSETF